MTLPCSRRAQVRAPIRRRACGTMSRAIGTSTTRTASGSAVPTPLRSKQRTRALLGERVDERDRLSTETLRECATSARSASTARKPFARRSEYRRAVPSRSPSNTTSSAVQDVTLPPRPECARGSSRAGARSGDSRQRVGEAPRRDRRDAARRERGTERAEHGQRDRERGHRLEERAAIIASSAPLTAARAAHVQASTADTAQSNRLTARSARGLDLDTRTRASGGGPAASTTRSIGAGHRRRARRRQCARRAHRLLEEIACADEQRFPILDRRRAFLWPRPCRSRCSRPEPDRRRGDGIEQPAAALSHRMRPRWLTTTRRWPGLLAATEPSSKVAFSAHPL